MTGNSMGKATLPANKLGFATPGNCLKDDQPLFRHMDWQSPYIPGCEIVLIYRVSRENTVQRLGDFAFSSRAITRR